MPSSLPRQEIHVRIRPDADEAYAGEILRSAIQAHGWFSVDEDEYVEVIVHARSPVAGVERMTSVLNDQVASREGLDGKRRPTEWARLFNVEPGMP